ncbi:hypothetical protein TELCIR_11269 [Teladorsagia circumcincta]|uniref:ATP-dependent DNA helicase n=1 Tax=Teladorsagia circumcincta TaxID=45464 RepID=A0A2G9UBZ0_TELCI|nr:hypothetical protein TELCIR_11269 [Teladorsagia circumcincta]
MRRQQVEAHQLAATDLIIWDEISMTPKVALEAVDALLRDIAQLSTPFGGKVVVLGGDFRQILPVVENGRREDIIEACVRNSSLWPLFTIHRLNTNMRIQAGESGWHTRLLEIGSGDANDSDDKVSVPSTMLCATGIVNEIFGAVINPDDLSQLCECAILAPKNIHVQHLNEQALDRLRISNPEDERCYRSIDEAVYPEGQNEQLFSMEYLNTLTPTGMPPHELRLKRGPVDMFIETDCSDHFWNRSIEMEDLAEKDITTRRVSSTVLSEYEGVHLYADFEKSDTRGVELKLYWTLRNNFHRLKRAAQTYYAILPWRCPSVLEQWEPWVSPSSV